MAKFKEKMIARKERELGCSINEIANKYGFPKSSVSYWCKDIKLTPDQINKLAKKQISASYRGRLKALEQKRENRLRNIAELREVGIQEIGFLNKKEFQLAGLGLYWGEGYKSLTTAAVVSSNPKIVLFMIRWFEKVCQVKRQDLILRIGLNYSHKNRINKVEKYWADLTGIPLVQFTKTTFIKSKNKKIFNNPEDYFGTLRISIRKSSKLQRKILGWLEGLFLAL